MVGESAPDSRRPLDTCYDKTARRLIGYADQVLFLISAISIGDSRLLLCV